MISHVSRVSTLEVTYSNITICTAIDTISKQANKFHEHFRIGKTL